MLHLLYSYFLTFLSDDFSRAYTIIKFWFFNFAALMPMTVPHENVKLNDQIMSYMNLLTSLDDLFHF